MQNTSSRHVIIQAATDHFLECNFHQVSMAKIAEDALVSKVTLYQYFDNKHDLLAACITEYCSELLQLMDETTISPDSVETSLETIANVFFDLVFDAKGLALYRIVIAECSDFPEFGEKVYASGPKIGLQILQQYLESINQLGIFNIRDTKFSADVFFSLIKGERHFQCLLGIRPVPTAEEKQKIIAQAVKFYIQGFLYAVQ